MYRILHAWVEGVQHCFCCTFKENLLARNQSARDFISLSIFSLSCCMLLELIQIVVSSANGRTIHDEFWITLGRSFV